MPSPIRASEAASLAIHSLAVLADSPRAPVTAHEMATVLDVSEAHLAKVLHRLSVAGLVRATRGPGGGFELPRRPEDITLKQIYEAVEGPLEAACMFSVPVCQGGRCALGDFFRSVSQQILHKLSSTRLSEMHLDLGDRRKDG